MNTFGNKKGKKTIIKYFQLFFKYFKRKERSHLRNENVTRLDDCDELGLIINYLFSKYFVTTPEPGARLVFTHGLTWCNI